MKTKFLISTLLIVLIFSFTACNTPKVVTETTTTQTETTVTETTPEYPDFIELTLGGERKGSDIIFYGTTNLPDGALIVYEVTLPETLYDENYFAETGNLTIKDGKYSGKVSNVPEGKGEAEIWIAFQTILGTEVKQPQGAIVKYGELGEKMKGDNVVKSGDIKRIELITKIADEITIDESEDYIAQIVVIGLKISESLGTWGQSCTDVGNGIIGISENKKDASNYIKDINDCYDIFLSLKVPEKFNVSHKLMETAMDHLINCNVYLQQYIDTENISDMTSYLGKATSEMNMATEYINKATEQYSKLK